MRKLMRSVARAKMKKAGIAHMNRKDGTDRSYFAQHWREYVGTAAKSDEHGQ